MSNIDFLVISHFTFAFSIAKPLKNCVTPNISKESPNTPTGDFSNLISNCGLLYSSTCIFSLIPPWELTKV